MPKLIDVQYHLHYTPPSLDTPVNQSFAEKSELLQDLVTAITTLLTDDCDLRLEDNSGNYLPLELTLRVIDTPSTEPIIVTL